MLVFLFLNRWRGLNRLRRAIHRDTHWTCLFGETSMSYTVQARSQGGGGGRTTPPPQLPIPKILFHTLAILFHPWNGACECPRVGAFFKLMTSRGQCPRGGGVAWCSTHPSSDPPHTHTHTWLAGYGPAVGYYSLVCLPSESY